MHSSADQPRRFRFGLVAQSAKLFFADRVAQFRPVIVDAAMRLDFIEQQEIRRCLRPEPQITGGVDRVLVTQRLQLAPTELPNRAAVDRPVVCGSQRGGDAAGALQGGFAFGVRSAAVFFDLMGADSRATFCGRIRDRGRIIIRPGPIALLGSELLDIRAPASRAVRRAFSEWR